MLIDQVGNYHTSYLPLFWIIMKLEKTEQVNSTAMRKDHHHHEKRLKRVNSVYAALNLLGSSVHNIYENYIHHRHRKRSSQSLNDLHVQSSPNDDGSLPSSTAELTGESPNNLKPNLSISDISEGPLSQPTSDNEDNMDGNHWQDSSSLESHENLQAGDASRIPSIPKRRQTHQKPNGQSNSNAISANWIDSATVEMEALQPPSQSSGIGESLDEDFSRESDSKPKQKSLRKTISFQTGHSDDEEDSDDSGSPKSRFSRTARKNSLAPHKAFIRGKAPEPQ